LILRNIEELVKSLRNDGFVKSSPAKAGQGAQKLRSEAHLSRVSRDNEEVEAQSRSQRDRWTFYETINIKNKEVYRKAVFFLAARFLLP
jgi:hypothetical protein